MTKLSFAEAQRVTVQSLGKGSSFHGVRQDGKVARRHIMEERKGKHRIGGMAPSGSSHEVPTGKGGAGQLQEIREAYAVPLAAKLHTQEWQDMEHVTGADLEQVGTFAKVLCAPCRL